MKDWKKIIVSAIFCITSLYAIAQQKDIALADEYFSVNDFTKAVDVYRKYVTKEEFRSLVYENYRTCELKLKNYDRLFKTLKKINKQQANDYLVHVDLIGVEKLGNMTKDYDKDFKRLYSLVKDDPYALYQCAQQLETRRMYTEYTKILLDLRNHQKNEELYVQELIDIYRATGNTEGLIDESLAFVRRNPADRENIENLFQADFKEDDYQLLEKKLFEKIGSDEHYVYRELLVWFYLQQKNFYDAYIQQRAIDISKRERGFGLLKIAEIATTNKDYGQAVEILRYVCEKYEGQEIYVKAKTRLIEIKEIQAKENYPVDTAQINQLLDDYNQLLITAQDQNEKSKIEHNQANLYAFYLHDNNKAIELLTKITKTGGISRNRQANAWLLLGDVYLLDNQVGEASLTYFQVEKRWKNSTYAEKAKLKNAKLYFYTGEFDLSQSMLDILKRATSREISNDAIDLSIFIKSNSGLDTSYDALQLYADADLLTYQKKFDQALTTYDQLLTKFNNHSLTDEVYWQKANIYKQTKQLDKEIAQLELLTKEYGIDIWADDATFRLAESYQQKGDNKLAMEYYKKVLLEYKNSVYVEKARINYRKLRGDSI